MFNSVLVANRGEIAVRVIKSLKRLGIRAIAVYSDADRDALHVAEADQAVRIGPAEAARSYLDPNRIMAAVASAGAEAVHPGYGFLSENAALPELCATAGVAFIGPPASAIRTMGDKINAKRTVAAAGVPVVPGRDESGLDDDQLAQAASEIGFPVLLKPSAGGGGKGMRRVDRSEQFGDEIAAARREARAAFGDDTILVERFISAPRHIEIQVFADQHGNMVHLGERECSLQRRHQKIIEESPSPLLDDRMRSAMGEDAVSAARSVAYVGAGTVEFIVSSDRPDGHFFMEMNTRLQVEHPVTELVTGLDLVEWQVRVAAGEALSLRQDEVCFHGHAIEARVYSEDPARGFLPSSGPVLKLAEPTHMTAVRVDSGVRQGTEVGTWYDPILEKIIAWGVDRSQAISRLDAALSETTVLGLSTNVAFCRRLLSWPAVREGDLDTELVDRSIEALTDFPVPASVPVAAAMFRALELEPRGRVVDPWELPGGWRVGKDAEMTLDLSVASQDFEVGLTGRAFDAAIRAGDASPSSARGWWEGDQMVIEMSGGTAKWHCARAGDDVWLGTGGESWKVHFRNRVSPAPETRGPGSGSLTSPMPGTVLDVRVEEGKPVEEGQTLLTVEAMKMEHSIKAPFSGVVTELLVREGQQVASDQALVVIAESLVGNGRELPE